MSEMGTEPTYDTRHRHDVFHHGAPGGASASANATVMGGNGASGPAPPAQPVSAYTYHGGIYWPEWLSQVLALLGVLILATLAVFGLAKLYGHWFDDQNSSNPVTIVDVLRGEHFAVNGHALCSYVPVGTVYKLYLNRGAGCRHTVQAVVPATMVDSLRSKHLRRSSVTFVYNKVPLSSDEVQDIKRLSLGQQVMHDLRNVVARERK
jgi:hypothetical protein